MTTFQMRAGIALFLGIAVFAACTDHRESMVSPGSGANRLRIKTLRQESPNSPAKVSSFQYDGQGRLSLIIGYQLPDSSAAPVENTVYGYDAQNRLTQVQRSIVRRGSYSETYTYRYNGAGQVAELSHLPSTYFINPSYTSGNQVSSYTKTIGVGGLQGNGGGRFTFTGNNLTLATEQFSVFRSGGSPTAPPVFSTSTSTTYTYDDKLNPFYGTFIIPAPGVFSPMPVSGQFGPYYTYYGGIDNPFNLSQNNVLSGGGKTYTYAYNSANLPTVRTTTTGGAVVETLYYEYETY